MKTNQTFSRARNSGFSLVELIVVIAIMAILVGVAVPVYGAYVDKSKKAVDIDLVSGITHAIKTGTYSQSFVGDDSFKMGSLSYPVGFVVLTTEGAKVVVSQTEIYPPTSGKCEFVTLENVATITEHTVKPCSNSEAVYYSYTKGSITYCKTHSPEPTIEDKSGQTYTSSYKHTAGAFYCARGCESFTLTSSTYPSDTNEVTNVDALYTVISDTTLCEAAYANQYGTYGSPNIGEATASNPLYDAIVAAYGTDLSELKLTYDEWTSGEGIDYATFYTSAPQLMADMEDLSGTLATGSQYQETIKKLTGIDLGVSTEYEDEEAVLKGVSQNIVGTHDMTTWMIQWDNDAAMTWDSYGFGLTGRENYSAARMAYNNAFASYLEARGETAYLTEIREFYAQSVNADLFFTEINIGLPGLICTDAFTASDSPLREKITNEDDFNRIAELYQEYLASDAHEENGKLVFNTLATFNDTSDVASAYADQHGGSIYDYYNTYVAEMSALYNAAQTAAGEGIVIIVTVENGLLNFMTSPAEAYPQN